MMENKELIKRVLDAIKYKLDYLEQEVKNIEKVIDNNPYLISLSKDMSNDVIEFADNFYNFTEGEKEEFNNKTEDVFAKDFSVSLTELNEEIKNLFFLKEDGLLGTDVVEEQYSRAVSCINNFRRMLEKYNKKIMDMVDHDHPIYVDNILELKALRDYFTETGLSKEIEDEEKFSREIYKLDLVGKDKEQLMFLMNDNNIAIFKEKLEKNSKKSVEYAQDILDVKQKNKTFKVSEEVINKIDELLNDSKVMNKILSAIEVVNEDDVLATHDIIRETIIERLEDNDKLDVEEVFDEIYREITKDDVLVKLENRLFDETSVVYKLDKTEQLELLERAKIFYDYNKGLLIDLSADTNTKELYNSIIDSFTLARENREIIYNNKICSNLNELNLLVAYEIGLILRVVDSIDRNDYIKVMSRIKDIFDIYDNVFVNNIIKVPTNMNENDKGHLFFIDITGNVSDNSLFVEDVNFGSKKGIPKQYYPGLVSSLKNIENRYELDDHYKHGKYVSEPILKEFRVRFKDSNRTRVVYIPVGEKDAIILGTRCKGYVESNQHDFANRVKKISGSLKGLIDIINEKNDIYWQMLKVNRDIENSILESLDVKRGSILEENYIEEELDKMLDNSEENTIYTEEVKTI